MRRSLVAVSVLVVVLALLGLVAWSAPRVLAPGDEERAALALVEAGPGPSGGRDGFAAAYTVRHDIPESQWQQVLEADVRRHAAVAGKGTAWASQLDDWPKLERKAEGDPAWCSLRSSGCLAQVRMGREAYAELLRREARLVERAADLRGYDHFRNPFVPTPDMPLATVPATRLATRTAWFFVSGEVDLALADACADIALGRRMLESGDSLISSLVGATMVHRNATLLAQMLAELPRDHPLPGQCGSAVQQPVPVAQGICSAMLDEGRLTIAGIRSLVAEAPSNAAKKGVPGWAPFLAFDPRRTTAQMAAGFAWYCGDEARSMVARDQPLRHPPVPPGGLRACMFNWSGCKLARIDHSSRDGHAMRLQDAAARIDVMATLLWLRGQGGEIDEAALAAVPEGLGLTTRPLHLDREMATLRMPLHATGSGEDKAGTDWTIPLPGSRVQSP